jgi:hypothetical protein
MNHKEHGDYIREEFTDFDDFLNTIASRTPTSSFGGRNAKESTDNDWRGGTWDECIEWLKYGRKTHVESIDKSLSKQLATVTKNSYRSYNSVQGYAPNVPNYLLGVPETMIDMKVIPKKSKVLSVYVNIGCSASRSEKDCVEFGKKLLAYLQKLELNGYRIKISVCDIFTKDESGAPCYTLSIPVKHESQPLDISRVCFPLIYAGMKRRLFFYWYESLPNAKYMSGYGLPLDKFSNQTRKKNRIEYMIGKNNGVYIEDGCDIEAAFSQYVKDIPLK